MKASTVKRVLFWCFLGASAALAIAIFMLTSQSPEQTTSLSSRVARLMEKLANRGVPGVGRMLSIASVRKWAHTFEFFLLGATVALSALTWNGNVRSGLARLAAALGVCVAGSMFDQTHKLFVPGREFDAGDLVFDALGYGCALILVFGVAALARAIVPARRPRGRHYA